MKNNCLVELEASDPPEFPNRCVGCLGLPDSTAFVFHDAGVSFYRRRSILIEALGSGGGVKIPLCRSCWWKLRCQRLIQSWAWIAVGALTYFLIQTLVFRAPLDTLQRGYLVVAVVAIFSAPMIYLELSVTPIFRSYRGAGCTVCYEFLNMEYAALFRGSNAGRLASASSENDPS
jgi:hypothetical protein